MKRQKVLKDDEYNDDYLNEVLYEKSLKKWEIRVGHSPTRVIGKRMKYRDANWMP